MASYEELKATLLADPSLEVGAGVSEEEVRAAEARLGSFPEDYIQFLRDFGWASFGSREIWGLGEKPVPGLDLVPNALAEWSDYTLPTHLIPFYNNGGGDLSCMPVETERALGEAGVQVFWHDEQKAQPYAASFSDYVMYLITREEKYLIR